MNLGRILIFLRFIWPINNSGKFSLDLSFALTAARIGNKFKSTYSVAEWEIGTPRYLNLPTHCRRTLGGTKDLGPRINGKKLRLCPVHLEASELRKKYWAFGGHLVGMDLGRWGRRAGYQCTGPPSPPASQYVDLWSLDWRRATATCFLARRARERGQPCRLPLCSEKGSDNWLPNLIDALGCLYSVHSHFLKLSGKPKHQHC